MFEWNEGLSDIYASACATDTADGRRAMLAVGRHGQLYGSVRPRGERPCWVLLANDAPEEIHIGLHGSDGRLVALARSRDGRILHRWFEPDGVEPWEWQPLDGMSSLPILLVERMTGGLEAFRIDAEGILWHRWTNGEMRWADAWGDLTGVQPSGWLWAKTCVRCARMPGTGAWRCLPGARTKACGQD